jgi:prevent-host-death family protein
MVIVDIQQAKAQLSTLVARAAKGEAFIIARAGKPLVRVTAVGAPSVARRLGFLSGEIAVPKDFDRMGAAAIRKPFGDGA